jgi:hypothetical protein
MFDVVFGGGDMNPMEKGWVFQILFKAGCGRLSEAFERGEPIEDGAATCEWLEAMFHDIPRLREFSGMLLMKTGGEVACFEDTSQQVLQPIRL